MAYRLEVAGFIFLFAKITLPSRRHARNVATDSLNKSTVSIDIKSKRELLNLRLAKYQKIDDFELVNRAVAGEKSAFDQLMEKYFPLCYRFARKYGLNAEDAADVLQDTFVAAYKALHRYNSRYKFSTWILTILLNRVSNRRRALRRAHRYFYSSTGVKPDEHLRTKMHVSTPEENLENDELQQEIHSAIEQLPQKLRAVFILFEIEQIKIREIAQILRIPEGTVTSRLHAARVKLRTQLKAYFTN